MFTVAFLITTTSGRLAGYLVQDRVGSSSEQLSRVALVPTVPKLPLRLLRTLALGTGSGLQVLPEHLLRDASVGRLSRGGDGLGGKGEGEVVALSGIAAQRAQLEGLIFALDTSAASTRHKDRPAPKIADITVSER